MTTNSKILSLKSFSICSYVLAAGAGRVFAVFAVLVAMLFQNACSIFDDEPIWFYCGPFPVGTKSFLNKKSFVNREVDDLAYCKNQITTGSLSGEHATDVPYLNIDPPLESDIEIPPIRDCMTKLTFGWSLTELRDRFQEDLGTCVAQYDSTKLPSSGKKVLYKFGNLPEYWSTPSLQPDSARNRVVLCMRSKNYCHIRNPKFPSP
jgi:hypothetical protein